MIALRHLKIAGLICFVCFIAAVISFFIAAGSTGAAESKAVGKTATVSTKEGIKAFESVRLVLQSPRCRNCHIPGDAPLQGDEGRFHDMNVKRGKDGRGTPDMKCTDCHGAKSSSEPNTPPGLPDWRLPELSMPLVFIGLSADELCGNLKNPMKNGHKTLEELIKHVSEDPFVLWGWNPGTGRTSPPISHKEFVAQLTKWVSAGAPCPER